MRLAFLLLISVVALPLMAQSTSHNNRSTDCLVNLKAPNPNFASSNQPENLQVIAHSSSNSNWWIRVAAGSCSSLRDLDGVKDVVAPANVIVSLENSAQVPEKEIEEMGGIVFRKFVNIPSAAIVVPPDKISELAALPGIKRVQKDHGVSQTGNPSTIEK